MPLVVLDQAVLVRRQAEEPVPFREPLELDVGVVGALHAVRRLEQVRDRLEALVGAVPALVGAEVDVAVGIRAAHHLLGREVVVGVGRADEPVGADEQRVLGRPEQRDLLVDELARRSSFGLGRLGDVHGVLVRAGQEPRVVAQHAVPARDDVRPDDLVHRVQAGGVVRVRDGGRQVVPAAFGHAGRS